MKSSSQIKRIIYLAFLLASAMLSRAQAPNDFYGVHASELTDVPMATLSHIANMLDSANIRWVRLVLPWKEIQPTPTQWQWGDLRQRLDTLHSYNLKIIAILYKVPDWASSAPTGTNPLLIPYYSPRDTLEWIVYIDSTVRKFKDIISHWEIWNEPDNGFMYAPVVGTKHLRYVELLRSAYRTIKQKDPSAKVVFAGLTSGVGQFPKSLFIDSVMAHGAADYFDIMNVHFYRYEDTPIQKVMNVLAKYGKSAPVWVTETNNWHSLLPNNTEQRSADSLRPWLNYLRSLSPEKVFWFSLTNFYGWGSPVSIVWGLFNKSDYTPTAVYSAYMNYIASVTSVYKKDFSMRSEFILFQNYPNPFNTTTTIHFTLPADNHVTLKVFDILGCEMATLVDGEMNAGEHSVVFDAVNLPSGVYFYRLQTDKFVQLRKMEVLK